MEVQHVKIHNISWRTTFNGHLASIRSQLSAFNEARKAGYPYIAWNGWVYESKGEGSDDDRIVLAESLGE